MHIVPFNTVARPNPIVPLTPPDGAGRAQWPQWREALPTLIYHTTRLRELRASDAAPLLSMLTTEEVTRFIPPPPFSREGFERFIQWSREKRMAGEHLCFGVVPRGYDAPVGIFQIQLTKSTPEWGFAIGSPFWGTGLFEQAAEAVLDFAFHGMGLDELCAYSAVDNARGNRALQKTGAVRERIVHGGFVRNGKAIDQNYWTVSAAGRPRRKVIWEGPAH